MVTIKFSKNWNNKMCCNIFTTIRYRFPAKVGDIVAISTKGTYGIIDTHARVVSKESFYLKDIPEAIFSFDMGMNKDMAIKEIQKIYKDYDCSSIKFDVVCLKHHYNHPTPTTP